MFSTFIPLGIPISCLIGFTVVVVYLILDKLIGHKASAILSSIVYIISEIVFFIYVKQKYSLDDFSISFGITRGLTFVHFFWEYVIGMGVVILYSIIVRVVEYVRGLN